MISLYLVFPMKFNYYFGIQEIIMLLSELSAPITDLSKKINETWRRL
jgi:hypothetical protein